MQYCASARCLRITDSTAVMSRLTTSAHIFRVSYSMSTSSEKRRIVAESGEIDSPFSILGCVINVLYNSRATRCTFTHTQLETCTSPSLSMKRTRDVLCVWNLSMTVTAWCDCRRMQIISGRFLGKFTNKIIYLYVN